MSKTSKTINNIKKMLDNVSGLYLDEEIEKLEKQVKLFCKKVKQEQKISPRVKALVGGESNE